MLYKKKLVTDVEKLVTDFEHFTITHPHTILGVYECG